MREYKSAQDLILKAALYDGVSTTIRPGTYGDKPIEVVFSRKGVCSSVSIDLMFEDERSILYSMKRALLNLFEYPYKDIVVKEK